MFKKAALLVTALFIATVALTGMSEAASARDYISICLLYTSDAADEVVPV